MTLKKYYATPPNYRLISFSFRAWIGLIWEISARAARQNAWNFGARLFWNDTTLSEFKDIRYIKVFLDAASEKCSCPSMYIMHIHIHMHIHMQIDIPYMGPGPAAARPPVPGPCKVYVFVYVHAYVYVYALCTYLDKNIFQYIQDPGSSKWLEIQYFQDPGFLKWVQIQYFQDPGSLKWIEIQYFQDPGSLKWLEIQDPSSQNLIKK